MEGKLLELLARQKQCEENAHYGEAGLIEERIQLTKAEISKQKLLELRRRHREESLELEQEMKLEFQRFLDF